jgi:GTP-binding protein
MTADLIITAAQPRQFPSESLPEIAFMGRSNVGKSSLLNRLVGQKGLAFTSSTPGRTQAINFYRVGDAYCFVDLPGYGYARAPAEAVRRWKGLVESYLLDRQALRLSIMLIDSRRGWMPADLELKSWLEAHHREYLVVATKIDKLNQSELHHGLTAIRQHGPDEPLACSAVTGRGVREIWQAISKINTPAR